MLRPRSSLAALFVVPVLATLSGGYVAIRCRRWIHLLVAVGAGVLVGAAFLDLLPEALKLGAAANVTPTQVFEIALAAFLTFFLIERLPDLFSSESRQTSLVAGRLSALMLVLHSFRDGMAIGASFHASPMAGYTVALGVGAHDFGDGLNTVLLCSRGGKAQRADYIFLLADALAPVAGGIAAAYFFSSLKDSVILLATAAGFFIEMAATNLLPELRIYAKTRAWTVPSVLAGIGLIYLANTLLNAGR